ncbi:MAG: hypothetical protein SOR77_00850 [Peptoniphilus sp.]|uniref:hypothetical protein n=1 Tax=Peptoniphilus sp. TaxID=1971214 RepID=UPI002A7575AE|nr:hypothetical protein [Peptoniphilus sp.]MDY2986157.1 hypothetical protein [Peptoniphilus sp.]
MKDNDIVKKYRILAIIGIVLMGIASFMSCLATSKMYINIGTILLCISIVLSIIGFSRWQP